MMRFDVRHVTRFWYTRPVFLEPLTVRLRPRSDPAQRLLSFEMEITPRPAGVSEFVDLEGNSVAHAWFEGETSSLEVRTSCSVETLRTNPFDFILVDPGVQRVPVVYEAEHDAVLDAYLARARPSAEVDALAADVGGDTISFLRELTARIASVCTTVVREDGDPWPPSHTLAERTGSCRDLAVLFVDACRSQGLAARFVSGYHEPEEEAELHAWAEVYLQDAGWRGFDPSAGLAVADRHVALAAAPVPRAAAPTSGSFRGDATSRMEAGIQLYVHVR